MALAVAVKGVENGRKLLLQDEHELANE